MAADAQCFVVFQSEKETLQEVYAEKRPPFTYICDPSMALYRQFEIGDQDRRYSDPVLDAKKAANKEKMAALGLVHGKYEGNEEQAPACFILDKDMNVVYSHYGINSVDVPYVAELAELVGKLG